MELRDLEHDNIIYKLLHVQIDKICRTCLTENAAMTSVFSEITNNNSIVQIREMISLLTNVTIAEDGLPNQICMDCVSRASVGFQFRLQTQKSDGILKELSNTNIEKVMKLNNTPQNENETKPISDLDIVEEVIKETTEQKEIIDYKDSVIENEIINETKDIKLSTSTRPIRKRKRKQHDQKTEPEISETNNLDSSTSTTIIYNDKPDFDDTVTDDNDDDDLGLDILKKRLMDTKLKKSKETRQDLFVNPNSEQTCSVCNDVFPDMNVLIKHRLQNHGPKKFQCQTCGNGFTTTRGLRIHLRLHTGEKPEVCSICNKAFSDPRTLRNHSRIHSGDQPFPCTQCDKRFPARLPLLYHMRSHNGERPHQCHLCPKSYIQQNSLQIHLRTHTGEKPYVCKFCDKGFTNATSLSLHQLTHNGVKNYQCAVCGKRMARSGELTVHLRTHTGEKPFACQVCGKRFTNSSALKAHQPTHTGEKNFVCAVCGKRVARAMELRIHTRTHTGERNFACSYCDKRFATSSNLRLHQRKHTGEKPYRCPQCPRAFADSHVLRNHQRTHTGERPYRCAVPQCGARFAQRGSLSTHMRTHDKNGGAGMGKVRTSIGSNETPLRDPSHVNQQPEQQLLPIPLQIQDNSPQISYNTTNPSTNLIGDDVTTPILRNIIVETNHDDRQCLLIGEPNQHGINDIRQNDLDFDTTRFNNRDSIYTYSYQN